MSDTRKDKRAPVSLKVRFKSATVDEFIEHYCKDVSRGGIFIKSSQPMPVGTLLKFQFQLKDESQLIKGVGRVVWTRNEDRAGPDRPAGMGIKFIKMDNESRVMVDRIISASEGSAGAFEEGRETDVADSVTPPPALGTDSGFFPDVGPAELPPPEDRTAVREAAGFLAQAFSEVSDEAAAKEAEQKAEEARMRQQQIEAQRLAEAEQQRKGAADPLPSMIIDPGLSGPPKARTSESPGVLEAPAGEAPATPLTKPSPLPPPPKVPSPPAAPKPAAPPAPAAAPAPQAALAGADSVSSLSPPAGEKRSPVLPILAIVAVLGVAGFVAMRGGPQGADEPTPAAAVDAKQPEPAANEPAEPAPAPEQQAAEPSAPVEPTPSAEPEEFALPEEPVETVAIRVSTQPPGAQVSVGGVVKGEAPVVLDLEKGAAATVIVSMRGYASASEEITPESAKTVRFALKMLPLVLHVETTPPGATVIVSGKRGVAPVDLTWPTPPKTALKATAKLAGYQNAEAQLALESLTQGEDAMRGTIQLTLEPAPEKPVAAPAAAPAPAAPKPKQPVVKLKPEEDSAGSGESAPAAPKPAEPKVEPEPAPAPKAEEPKAEPKPAEPKPEPPKAEPKPAEPLPDNPFG